VIRTATIPAALDDCVGRSAGEYVFHLDEGVSRLSCVDLVERAHDVARRLVAAGVQTGDRVGVLGPNRPEWVVSAFAVWYAGAALVPIQKRLHIRNTAAFEEQLAVLLGTARCRLVLVEPDLASLLPHGIAIPWGGEGEKSSEGLAPVGTESPAVVQFTSGSTAAPRGALLTHGAVMAQMRILDPLSAVGNARRTSISWTPFFHDLGLFLNVLPSAVWGLTSHHLPTERFARDPVEWFRLTEANRASLTLAPSSSFGNTLRALESRGERVDLGSLDAVRFAAEGVDPNVLERMEEAAPRLNLRPDALGSSYGLAEAVLAVTYTLPGAGLAKERISLDALAGEGMAIPATAGPSRTLIACGPPLMELRIAGPNGALPERSVGEILVRGESLMSGYVGEQGGEPFAAGGWLRTGDLGYLADGQLYVTGRIKDMVIAMGHNYYPEDFEWAAARVDGVRQGRCIAFNPAETEDVVLVVEVRNGHPARIADRVGDEVADTIGVRPSEVVTVTAGTVPKTTSGKLQRSAMRELYANRDLAGAST